MDEILLDEDAEINLNENQNTTETKRPFYFKSLKNYISAMIKIKWRTHSYKFAYFSSALMIFMAASLFSSIQTEPNKKPLPLFITSTSFTKLLAMDNVAFTPNSTEVRDLVSLLKKPINDTIKIYDNLKEMSDNISYNNQILYGFYIQDNYSNITVITNDALNLYSSKYHMIELVILNKFYPDLEIRLNGREYAKPPESISIESVSAAFYLIFPYFYWMIMSLNADVSFSVKRLTFSLLINGLPELILYLGRTLCYFLEMLPIGLFFIIIMNQFVIAMEVNIDMFYFTCLLTVFLLSYSLRFVTYSTFIHSEKTMSFWVTILQVINFVELATLDDFPTYSSLFQVSLLVCIPQYPLLVAYYEFLRSESKEIQWSTKAVSGFFSYKELFYFQVLNVFLNVILTLFFILMNSQSFGLPLIGWRNFFKRRYWRRLFRATPIRLSFNHHYLIQLHDIKYTYKSSEKTVALNGIDLSVVKNEVIVFVGPNGSGKSTLIDVLTGAIEQDEGEVKICEFELRDVYFEYHSELGVVFQANTLFDKLSAREHFKLFSFRIGDEATVNSEIERLSNLLQFSNVMDTFSEDLSGGEKRKLCLALALLQHPRFLILDEPTAGVDAFCRRQIWKVVGDLSSSMTTIASTHSLEESEYISSRFAVLRKGQIAFLGTGAEMRLKFNSGYKITFIDLADINLNELLELIQKVIPEATISVDKKNTIVLPSDLRVSDALDIIEENKNRLGITKYTVQVDNLEESFVKLIEEEEGAIHIEG
ncbi:hypothetical protein M9Y10_032755 [Tritrichomonas musculus]|uniref:ABC transporter domain-containing protein n=1 Tax=Tritrichomonas musculus TaxID=1915356 RepID=A0ABR2GYL6_9EUKA